MIGRLSGRLLDKRPPLLLVDVQGVGYEVEAPLSTHFKLPDVGQPVTLHIHHHVREDAHTLYGFLSEAERQLFRQLIRVSGVGVRMALAILSGMEPQAFAACIRAGDTAALVRLPGIGKKTAERLVVEMRDRLGEPAGAAPAAAGAAPAPAAGGDPQAEAVEALVALGYRPAEAGRLVRKVAAPDMGAEDLIRAALKAAL